MNAFAKAAPVLDQPFNAPIPAAARLRDLLDSFRFSDAEAVETLGVSLMTVRCWLKSEYLPPNVAYIALESILASRRFRQLDAVATAYPLATEECDIAAKMCAALATAELLRGSARRFSLLAESFAELANELRSPSG